MFTEPTTLITGAETTTGQTNETTTTTGKTGTQTGTETGTPKKMTSQTNGETLNTGCGVA